MRYNHDINVMIYGGSVSVIMYDGEGSCYVPSLWTLDHDGVGIGNVCWLKKFAFEKLIRC